MSLSSRFSLLAQNAKICADEDIIEVTVQILVVRHRLKKLAIPQIIISVALEVKNTVVLVVSFLPLRVLPERSLHCMSCVLCFFFSSRLISPSLPL